MLNIKESRMTTKFALTMGLTIGCALFYSNTNTRSVATVSEVSETTPVQEKKLTLNEIYKLAYYPSQKNWGLNKYIGVDAYEAWKQTQGSENIVVAVVDTGIDVTHAKLKSAMWVNQNEKGPWVPKNKTESDLAGEWCQDKSCNKIDDDNNGLIDDTNGWDFVKGQSISLDNHGHGTHIAGIIAAQVDMEKGTGGVAPKVKISGYRYYIESDEAFMETPEAKEMFKKGKTVQEALKIKDSLNLTNTIKALRQAVKHGANIINYSGGGYSSDSEELSVLKEAEEKGILVVVAAGNGTDIGNQPVDMDSSFSKYYPCAYNLKNIICVGNITFEGKPASSSNLGVNNIHVFAPGKDIYSTLPYNKMGPMTGTSQATAFVSGVAALILSKNPQLKPEQVKNLIMNTVDKEEGIKYSTLSRGKVNASKALSGIDNPELLLFDKNKQLALIKAEKEQEKNRSISNSRDFKPYQQKQKVKDELKEYIENQVYDQ